jgi:hypothetical protein
MGKEIRGRRKHCQIENCAPKATIYFASLETGSRWAEVRVPETLQIGSHLNSTWEQQWESSPPRILRHPHKAGVFST